MSLTKKHFEAMAKIIKGINTQTQAFAEDAGDEQSQRTARIQRHTLEAVAYNIADMCKKENQLFDKQRFIQACGL